MEQSPKQSPAAVEPVADLIERLLSLGDEDGAVSMTYETAGQALREASASLSHLSTKLENAERERDALRTYAHEATKAITGLTAGGSEYFGRKIGDIYTADLPFCVQRIRDRFEGEAERLHKALTEKSAAEAKLAEAKALIKDLEAHEGAEGFSVSTHTALEKFWKENQ